MRQEEEEAVHNVAEGLAFQIDEARLRSFGRAVDAIRKRVEAEVGTHEQQADREWG